MNILLSRRIVQKSRKKMWAMATSVMDMLGKNLVIEANLVISATKKEQAKLRPSYHPFPMHAGEHHGTLWWVGLDLIFFLQMTTMVFCSTLNLTLIESYFIFTLFCIQVTFLAFCIELDLIFTFFCMQVRVFLDILEVRIAALFLVQLESPYHEHEIVYQFSDPYLYIWPNATSI